MKIILTGSNGQLGTDLCKALKGHDVVKTVFETLDVSDAAAVRGLIAKEKPDVFLNTSAFHRVDDIESDATMAFAINALAAHKLALACRDADVALMHISTDYVFDGAKRAPYVESDIPNPLSAYGASKLAGELLIRNTWRKHMIIRSCGLYGTAGSMGKGGNFVNTMLRLAREGKNIRVVNDQVCTPTFTQDLAAQINTLIGAKQYGTFHMTSDGSCTWCEFAAEIFRLAGLAPNLQPATSAEFNFPATRPPYSVMENAHLKQLDLDHMRHWKLALADYMEELRNN